MTDDKRHPGRPRLYETSSEKLSAFRKRQESAGYLRKEVLVTQDTTDQVALLAKTHNVSVLDVASAMLEYGLSRYELEQSSALTVTSSPRVAPFSLARGTGLRQLRGDSVAFASAVHELTPAYSQPLTPTASDLLASGNNPIHNFFAKRKDSKNE
jgi:hypothetical protein